MSWGFNCIVELREPWTPWRTSKIVLFCWKKQLDCAMKECAVGDSNCPLATSLWKKINERVVFDESVFFKSRLKNMALVCPPMTMRPSLISSLKSFRKLNIYALCCTGWVDNGRHGLLRFASVFKYCRTSSSVNNFFWVWCCASFTKVFKSSKVIFDWK